MSNGPYNRETFMNAQDKTQKGMLFDMLESIDDRLSQVCRFRKDICEPRFKVLENRKWKDKGVAGAAGLIGGFLVGYLKKII